MRKIFKDYLESVPSAFFCQLRQTFVGISCENILELYEQVDEQLSSRVDLTTLIVNLSDMFRRFQ